MARRSDDRWFVGGAPVLALRERRRHCRAPTARPLCRRPPSMRIAGPPAYVQRLRQIEDEIAAHVERLELARLELSSAVVDADERERRWRELAHVPGRPFDL